MPSRHRDGSIWKKDPDQYFIKEYEEHPDWFIDENYQLYSFGCCCLIFYKLLGQQIFKVLNKKIFIS